MAGLLDVGQHESDEVADGDDRQLPREHQGSRERVGAEREEADDAQEQGDHEVERRLERVEVRPPLPLREEVECDEERQDEAGANERVHKHHAEFLCCRDVCVGLHRSKTKVILQLPVAVILHNRDEIVVWTCEEIVVRVRDLEGIVNAVEHGRDDPRDVV